MILVDQRELNNADGRLVHDKLGNPPTIWLDHGDYLVRGSGVTALVERVTNTGLLADIETGRMAEKLEGCADDADIVILLQEGLILPGRNGYALVQEGGYNFRYYDLQGPFPEGADLRMSFRRTGWWYRSVAEFLTSVSLRWVHKLEITLSPTKTAERLMEMDEYLSGRHQLHLIRSRPFNFRREDNIHEYLLCGLPGIGPERAKAIVECFGKAPIAWTVDEKQLSRVEGIGKTTARRLIDML